MCKGRLGRKEGRRVVEERGTCERTPEVEQEKERERSRGMGEHWGSCVGVCFGCTGDVQDERDGE